MADKIKPREDEQEIILTVRVIAPKNLKPGRVAKLIDRVIDNGYNESQDEENGEDKDCKDLGEMRIGKPQPAKVDAVVKRLWEDNILPHNVDDSEVFKGQVVDLIKKILR
jgi:hypothetical protein